MDPVTKYLNEHRGYARMKDMKAYGIHPREIRKLLKKGRIVKVKPGLYRIADFQTGESHGMVEICLAMPKAIICLSSALAFHELTTLVPTVLYFAIPRADKPIPLEYPPNRVYFFSANQYKAGIEHHETGAGHIRVYNPEKTVCDIFRYRSKLGEDLAIEALKEYLKRRNRDLTKLVKFAEICRVKGILTQYVKAIAG